MREGAHEQMNLSHLFPGSRRSRAHGLEAGGQDILYGMALVLTAAELQRALVLHPDQDISLQQKT